jgi:DNA polymerase III subunit beta
MEFTIARNELLAALYLTQGIVERRTTIPILSNVLVESDGEGVVITATDQEVAIRRKCKASVKQAGVLATGARKLYEMVRELPDGEVLVRCLENDWIEVSLGRSRFRLIGMSPEQFPAMPEPAPTVPALRLPGALLAEMIEHTFFAVSTDEARANLNGLYIESTEVDRLRMVATDGHRLAMIVRPSEGARLDKGVIIPRKAVQELRKVLESGDELVELFIEGGVAHVWRGPVRMSMRLVEGEFPDYRLVMPPSCSQLVEVDVSPLLAALRRVSVVSSERTRGARLQIEPGRLELSSINPDVGEAADEVEIDYSGEPLTLGFNARYMAEMLSILPSGGRVELGLNDDVSPGVMRELGDPDYCYIVMPMRL